MRIDPSGLHTTLNATNARSASRPTNQPTEPVTTAAAAESFAPTGELSRLLDGVREAPDIRPELVADVAARLAAGELLTPEAATDTARALLGESAPG